QKQLPELAAIWIKIGETKFHNKQYPSSLEAFEQGLALYKSVDAEEGIADAIAPIGQEHVCTSPLEYRIPPSSPSCSICRGTPYLFCDTESIFGKTTNSSSTTS